MKSQRSRLMIASCALLAATFAMASAAFGNVTISSKPTQNMSCSGGVCTPLARKAVLNAADLTGMLTSGDVEVASGSMAMDIGIEAPLRWTSTSKLTLDSYRSVNFDRPLIVAGTGALSIVTNDGGSGGDFRFSRKGHVEFRNANSALVINANQYLLATSMRMLARLAYPRLTLRYLALARSLNAAGKTYTNSPVRSFGATGGTLEGLGNTISNLTIDSSTNNGDLGLIGDFGTGADDAVIRDLGLLSVNIQGSGSVRVGALVGQNEGGRILNSYATGQISESFANYAGGLVGYNSGGRTIGSYARVDVSIGKFGDAGGLIGFNEGVFGDLGLVRQSYSTGAVTGGDTASIGALIGDNACGPIADVFSTGTVTGGSDSTSVGGLIGANELGPGGCLNLIANAYSIAAVSGGASGATGGLIGHDVAGSMIADTYWDLDTSGIGDPSKGAGNIANDPGITGLTTTGLQSALPAGFSPAIWGEDPAVNGGFPYLLASPPG